MTQTKSITLALQDGGSHGAFTWGVLDRLLEEPDLKIDAISSTGSGALNALALAQGLARGSTEAAQQELENLWRYLCKFDAFRPYNAGMGSLDLETSPILDQLTRLNLLRSPYNANPLNFSGLEYFVEEFFDFHVFADQDAPRIFVNLSDVNTGALRVFGQHELSAAVIRAANCDSHLDTAVEIDGGYYWGGRYLGNPALFPLFGDQMSDDILIVAIDPLKRDNVPKSTLEIVDRVSEIMSKAGVMRELRAINFIQHLIADGTLEDHRMKSPRIHMVTLPADLDILNTQQRQEATWAFCQHLKEVGRTEMQSWLETHANSLSKRSTVDLRGLF